VLNHCYCYVCDYLDAIPPMFRFSIRDMLSLTVVARGRHLSPSIQSRATSSPFNAKA